MNSKCDSCSTPFQWENYGSTSSEDEESLDDSNDDAKKKTMTFYHQGKTERTQNACVTIDEDEAWETWCEVMKDLKAHIYWKRKQVSLFIL